VCGRERERLYSISFENYNIHAYASMCQMRAIFGLVWFFLCVREYVCVYVIRAYVVYVCLFVCVYSHTYRDIRGNTTTCAWQAVEAFSQLTDANQHIDWMDLKDGNHLVRKKLFSLSYRYIHKFTWACTYCCMCMLSTTDSQARCGRAVAAAIFWVVYACVACACMCCPHS